jgi:hypothetical protein
LAGFLFFPFFPTLVSALGLAVFVAAWTFFLCVFSATTTRRRRIYARQQAASKVGRRLQLSAG